MTLVKTVLKFRVPYTPIEAKQGTNRAPMLYVLIGGLVLVVISFALMFLAH